MLELCLFDLDQTLLDTEDLAELRLAGKRNADPVYQQQLRVQLNRRSNRHIYTLQTLNMIRLRFPQMKLGVFTRSPSSYAQTVLQWAYPTFRWDVVVSYEDVERTKPSGDGILLAMQRLEVADLRRIVMVGDGVSDVRAAYHAGCWVVLNKGYWPAKPQNEHWWALERVPDAIISSPNELIRVLDNPEPFLPELERLLIGAQRFTPWGRFDRINHFAPEERGIYPIHCAGRSFANYESLQRRQAWHDLTAAIQEHKNSAVFPAEWVTAVRTFINPILRRVDRIFVTVVPHRPGRSARLEAFLQQIQTSYGGEAQARERGLWFVPGLLAYKAGVRSNSNDHLKKDERFANVRDHLFVNRPELVHDDALYVVIDDVTTTGSTLIYAKKYLQAAGAGDVTLFSLAKNISDVE
ncbi:HAD hydrolase-like protein [Massilia sp. 2TAF26]|uniref:HAD family hydrolase n=1 Tax=Massilia sp. 2TAF26 TaxID=3233012 RepID=UPI003F99E47E